MKKSFILIFAMASVIAVAQTQPQYKFEKGNIATELLFSPFSISINNNYYGETFSTGPFSMPGLRVRVACTDKLIFRATINLDFGHDKINKSLDDSTISFHYKEIRKGNTTEKNRFTEFSIAPGIEYHFGNWERISVYVGGELFFGLRTIQNSSDFKETIDYYQMNYHIEDFVYDQTIETISSIKTKNCNGYSCDPWGNCSYLQTGRMFLGLNVFTGMDFYVYKGLYLGAELGLGYTYAMALEGRVKGFITTTTSEKDTGIKKIDKTNIDEKFNDKITEGRLSFRCTPMIRLGWRF